MNAASDSDESDVDFVPDEKVCTDDEDGSQSDAEVDEEAENNEVKSNGKGKKRSSRNQKKSNNHSKRLRQDESDDVEKQKIDPTLEKKHEEDLWASFLNVDKSSSNSSSLGQNSAADSDSTAHQSRQGKEDGNGESGDSSSDVLNKSAKSANPPVQKRPGMGAVGGGLSSILNKIGKNNKLSTLEKSKLDWNSFKKDEGIEEEISVYNRGREGYLERQDFLQRTDIRQFEIEKDLRTTKRSNR